MEAKKKSKKDKNKSSPKRDNLDKESLIILDYMKRQNRPYSSLNVFDNLHGSIKKGLVQKTLDSLTENGLLKSKDYGSTKIYLVNQENMKELDEYGHREKDQQIKDLEEETSALKEKLKSQNSELKAIQDKLSLSEIHQKIEENSGKIKLIQEEIDKMHEDGAVSPEDMAGIENKLKVNRLKETQRRKICMSILNTLADIMDERVPRVKEILEFEDP